MADRDRPMLSVVVPVYQVRPYVGACLDSILRQSFTDLELVVVDDGSTDGSHDVVRSCADADDRVRVVRTENRGLGAARNRGVRESRGAYVAFVDSDDLLPPTAYETLLGTLHATGSDFAVGLREQFRSDGRRRPRDPLHAVHRERRLGIALDDFPLAMIDVFAWNKVFRRSFYDRIDLQWPEGIRYEDQPATIRAYLHADTFDVIPELVYRYRWRDDASSITQRRHELADLRDRITSKRLGTAAVLRHGSSQVREMWFRRALCGDLIAYFREIPACSDEYWDVLRDGVVSIWSHGWGLEHAQMPPPVRIVGWLVQEGRRQDASAVMRALAGGPPQRAEREGRQVADLPLLDDPTVPRDLFVFRQAAGA